MSRYYQISEDDLIEISDTLLKADNIIRGAFTAKDSKWRKNFEEVEILIENTFKNNKLYKASLV